MKLRFIATLVLIQSIAALSQAQVRDSGLSGVGVPDDLDDPLLIPAEESVFLEELTWMEVREALSSGKTTVIIATGGIEQNGPFVVLGKHNYVLQATTEAIARQLGNALVAPIVKYVPEGNIDPPEHHMRYPGTISLRPETFEAVLRDICASLKQHGFRDLVLIGDSGDNQAGMENVARQLNQEWREDSVRVHYIAEYYREDNRGRNLLGELGPEPAAVDPRLEGKTIHSAYRYEAIMATVDPALIRAASRRKAGLFQVDGYDLDPLDRTVAHGRRFVEYHATIAVRAIQKSLSQREP